MFKSSSIPWKPAAKGLADISFTVLESDLDTARKATQAAVKELDAERFVDDATISKVSVVGLGMADQSGVANRLFRALAKEGINIHAISTSAIKVSCLVDRDRGLEALRIAHREFGLDQAPEETVSFEETIAAAKTARKADAKAVIHRLQAMEHLTIDGCSLDDKQSLISLRGVNDEPGVAADLFEAIAGQGVLVDLIVQSIGTDGRTNVGFTVPRAEESKAQAVVEKMADKVGGTVSIEPNVAILGVTGIGVRSHTGVGTRIFRALSEAGINVELIGTSEVAISVVVAGDQGKKGLEAMQEVFADVII